MRLRRGDCVYQSVSSGGVNALSIQELSRRNEEAQRRSACQIQLVLPPRHSNVPRSTASLRPGNISGNERLAGVGC